MPLFEVAIILPQKLGTTEPEEIILTPTPVLAPDLEGAKVLAVAMASTKSTLADPVRQARWKVLARPFA